ncbi:Tetratricopeptide repeat-containing protein [Belliella buryatensis]|uniref:Tetratricopeptide repeat-containing protein n=1 Tax=Belliella buryatensis TaxID=1500549 RepID=A0A239D618_9BACT|nr:tetratricopeptide repeat protein [Belliella buryatensis]SNS27727.1 Tetratricopeptide repeat-containing protein [Belliella buryatensis]
MKKLILSIALAGLVSVSFAQKKVAKSAEKNFKKGELTTALEEINAALSNPETMDDPSNYLLKGKIQTKMFEAGDENEMSTVAIGRDAFGTFTKTMEMVDNDESSKVGKEVYKDDLAGMPENLRPFGIVTLKNTAFQKAIATYEEDNMEMAYEFFALAGDIDPTDSTMNFNAGYIANDLGKYEEAKKYFNRLLELEDYNKLNAYYFLIQIATSADADPEEALRLIGEARKADPTDKTLAEYEIQLLLQLNKMDEALTSVVSALENDPENAGILLRYGYLLEQSGDLEGALVQYKKSVEADPDFFEGNNYAGAIYLEKARVILNEVGNLSDEEWEKRADSMNKEAEGYYRDAVPYFTKATEIRPDSTDILEILFQIHTRLGNKEEAEKYNQKLIAILGENWMEG